MGKMQMTFIWDMYVSYSGAAFLFSLLQERSGNTPGVERRKLSIWRASGAELYSTNFILAKHLKCFHLS